MLISDGSYVFDYKKFVTEEEDDSVMEDDPLSLEDDRHVMKDDPLGSVEGDPDVVTLEDDINLDLDDLVSNHLDEAISMLVHLFKKLLHSLPLSLSTSKPTAWIRMSVLFRLPYKKQVSLISEPVT